MNTSERLHEIMSGKGYGDMADHAGMLYSIVRGTNPQFAVELGTREGDSTLVILHAMEDAMPLPKWQRKLLLSVDMEGCPKASDRVREDGLDVLWTFRQERTEDPAKKWEMLAQNLIGKAGIDFLLIDADHSFDSFLADMKGYAEHVASGGHIFIHDCVSYPGGVGRVVSEVAWPRLDFPYSNGVTIIQRPMDLSLPLWRSHE